MDEIEKNLEKLRNSPVNELTIKDIKLLSAYLTTQVKMDELTKRDKKFLGSYLKAHRYKILICVSCVSVKKEFIFLKTHLIGVVIL